MPANNWVYIEVDEIKKETEAAFLFLIDDEEVWIPKSQMADPDNYEMGDCDCEVSVTEWIANQKGLQR